MADDILQGGIQQVTQIAAQIVYLDFDGELTRYNGEFLTIDNVEVQHALLTTDRIENILSILNEKYVSQNVKFVTERPASGEYSTIYIGKTSAFDAYGTFAGLAETIDHNNANKSDNAFVNLDSSATDLEIVNTIAHETDHLLGTLDHGGEDLNAYGTTYYIVSGAVLEWKVLAYGDCVNVYNGGIANDITVDYSGSLYIRRDGNANSTIVNSGGYMYIARDGVANCATINAGGNLYIYKGGTAVAIKENGGYVSVAEGANVAFVSNTINELTLYNAEMTIHSNTVVNGIIVDSAHMYVFSGGITNNTTITSKGNVYVSSGGVANSTIVSANGVLEVSSGGVANSIVVTSKGYLYVNSGGVANSTIVKSGGNLIVSSGGTVNITFNPWLGESIYSAAGATVKYLERDKNIYIGNYDSGIISKCDSCFDLIISSGLSAIIYSGGVANNATVNSIGSICVANGGVVNNASINSSGTLTVFSGGVANSTTVNSGGVMYISSGGTANNTTLSCTYYGDAYLYVSSGGVANSTTVSSSGTLTVFSGGVANNATVNTGGDLYIESGGVANSANVNFLGYLDVLSGGTASIAFNPWQGSVYSSYGATVEYLERDKNIYIGNYDSGIISKCDSCFDLIISSGLSAIVYSNGTANNLTVNSSGLMYISSGGTANNATVISDGNLIVFSSGVTNNATVNSGGSLYVGSGGIANCTTVNFCGWLEVTPDAVANSTIVNSGGSLYVRSGGIANSITVNSGGEIFIDSATGVRAIKENGGYVSVAKGADVTFISNTIDGLTLSNTRMSIHSNTVADNTIVDHSYLNVYSGGVVNSTTVFVGNMNISSGGEANNTTVNYNGNLTVFSGGVANRSTINYGGGNVSNGGTANNTIVNCGVLNVYSSGTANYTTINSSGTLYVSGFVNSTTINSGGYLHIADGGAANTIVNSGGCLYIARGGTHKGSLQIEAGGSVSIDLNVSIDFTVAERSVEDDYLINNHALIQGAPTYTISVRDNLAAGTYKLARGAENFTGSILLGDGSVDYGWLTVNGEVLKYNDVSYSLNLSDGNLTLTVECAMSAPVLNGDKNGVEFTNIFGNAKIEFSKDNFIDVLQITPPTHAVDTYGMAAGLYQWQVCANGTCYQGGDIIPNNTTAPQTLISDADGNMDLFFANADSIWEKGYAAEHQGVLNGWNGTKERVYLNEKNHLSNIFAGSNDANILVMTDDANGDTLFLDDIYSIFGNQARIAKINEIRAGAGNDVIDMTSQRFAYSGDGMTIYGGLGDDTIWANNGNNTLFGDAGNDRIVGGAKNDIIIGGSGNDSMHGGGGDDVFCFGSNWGNDTIEQLSGGSVTLWFERGSVSNWNASTLTYSDGINNIQVSGVDNVTLKFGDVDTAVAGAFLGAASEKIFEDRNSGMIA